MVTASKTKPTITKCAPRRPRYEEKSYTVMHATQELSIMPLTGRERDLMRELCSARKLDLFYYEGALSLWMRVKEAYTWCNAQQQQKQQEHCPCSCSCRQSKECKLLHYLLTALHLTLKYCGPDNVEFHATTLKQAKETWEKLTAKVLFQAEISMCRQLNWVFF